MAVSHSVLLLSLSHLSLLFLLIARMDLLLVLVISCIRARMGQPLLLSLLQGHSIFSKAILSSMCFVSLDFFYLLNLSSHRSITSAQNFGELRPFVNVTKVPRPQIFAEKFKNHVMWVGQNRSVVFTMLGSVQACHLVEPTTLGQHICKAITIVPYGEAWRKFEVFMGDFYGKGQMRGPFDYGCLLTLSGRREGYSSPGTSSSLSIDLFLHLLLVLFA